MRGSDVRSGSLFSYVDLEARVGVEHPLRTIREIANAALKDLSGEFAALYTDFGRPSIAPEKLLRAMLLQAFYGIRSERQLMERLEFDLLFRWFVLARRKFATPNFGLDASRADLPTHRCADVRRRRYRLPGRLACLHADHHGHLLARGYRRPIEPVDGVGSAGSFGLPRCAYRL